MSECGGIICFQKRHVFLFWPFGALESAAVPFFPFLCIYTFHRVTALFLTICFLSHMLRIPLSFVVFMDGYLTFGHTAWRAVPMLLFIIRSCHYRYDRHVLAINIVWHMIDTTLLLHRYIG